MRHHTPVEWAGLVLAIMAGLAMLGWHWSNYFNGRYDRWARSHWGDE